MKITKEPTEMTYFEHLVDVAERELEATNTNLRDWYVGEFPTDELGAEIEEGASFYDLYEALDLRRDVYELIGVGDSVVRERLFAKLAEIMGVDYDYIYDQWMLGA